MPSTAATAVAAPPAARRRARAAVLCLMTNGVAALTLVYFVQPLLPALARRYDIPPSAAALALSITTFSLVAGLILVSPLADRWGSARLLRWSLTAATLLAGGAALASDWTTLLVLRALLGISLAAPLALPMSMIRRLAPDRYPALAGAYVAATGLGTALARLAPLPAMDAVGWPAVASGAALLAAVATASAWFAHLDEPRRRSGVSWGRAMLLPLRALGDRVILLLCALSFTSMGAFVGLFNAMGFRMSSTEFGGGASATLVYALYPLAIAGPLLATRWRARLGRTGAAYLCAGIMFVGVVAATVPNVIVAAVSLGVLTFGFLGLNSISAAWVVDRAHVTARPAVGSSSAYLAAYYAGSGALGILAVQVWSATGWTAAVALCVGLLGVVATVIHLASRRERRGAASGAATAPSPA